MAAGFCALAAHPFLDSAKRLANDMPPDEAETDVCRTVIDFRPLLFVIGILLTTVAVVMCLPAIADGVVNNPDWQVFAASALITMS